MARNARVDIGNIPYHVINRAVGRMQIFTTQDDYRVFIEVLQKAQEEYEMRILAFVLMPNHWHLVLYPNQDGDMGKFMHQVTSAHTRKVHAYTKTTGSGPLYQGRYKSFMIENDKHLLTVIKYIERNPVRAKLVKQCEGWQWGSAFLRKSKNSEKLLSNSLTPLPKNYFTWINEPEDRNTVQQVRSSVLRGAPYGNTVWKERMITKYDLISTVRSEGRPKKI